MIIQSGVKEEEQAAVEPLKERLQLQEKEIGELKEQFKEVMQEVKALREMSKNVEQFPALPVTGTLNSVFRGNSAPNTLPSTTVIRDPDYARKTRMLCADARKVVGFTPIGPRMIELQIESYGAKDQDEAMCMEVKSFLKCDLKMYPSEIQKLEIVKISTLSDRDDWSTLWVEFGSEYQVDKVFQHTRYMTKKDHRVLHWFPAEMQERRDAVEKIAFDIREDGRVHKTGIRTRLRVGRDDIELSTKLAGGKWRRELLPHDLPAIDFMYSPGPVQTSSPPPGRPGMTGIQARKRQKSPESEEDDVSKKQKQSESEEGMEGDKKAEKSVEHSMYETIGTPAMGLGDRGKFTGLEAYSPRTPAKAKSIPDLSVLLNSPVYHTKFGKK